MTCFASSLFFFFERGGGEKGSIKILSQVGLTK